MTERSDPSWEDNRAPHSCQAWSRQTCLWIMMIMFTKIFYCKDQRTNWKVTTTRQNEQILYGCKIPDYKWNRTILHDERHWRILSIHRFSGCREYTLPRDENLSEPKGWIRGNTKIGPVLDVATCCLQNKYGVEIRINSVNKDNSHSRVRISHGYELEQQRPKWKRARNLKMQFDECALKLNASYFASRSEARAKPQRRDSASSSTRTIPIEERFWTDIEQRKYSLSDYPVSKKLVHLLPHGNLHREDDGAVELWRIKRQSIVIPSWIQDWYGKSQFEQQTDNILPVDSMDKTIKILKRSTWKHRVLHNTCIKHGTNIRIRCIGSTSTLLWRKDWNSISNTIERYHSSRNTPSLLYPENCSDGNWKS